MPAGEVPFNHDILREAYALCHCLPVLSTDKFKTDFYDVSGNLGRVVVITYPGYINPGPDHPPPNSSVLSLAMQ